MKRTSTVGDAANHLPLSPISFLNRAAEVSGGKVAVVDDDGATMTYAQLRSHAARLASGLRQRGIERGDRVAILDWNSPVLLSAHFGVPAAGAALLALNTRLTPDDYLYVLRHAEVRVLLVAESLAAVIAPIQSELRETEIIRLPSSPGDEPASESAWDELMDQRLATEQLPSPESETDVIAINYTSGTTGTPKGVVYSHRGAYLNALSVCLGLGISADSRYLWTLPMFHCNGWALTWGVTAVTGTHVCLPKFEPAAACALLAKYQPTHLCGAPVVLNALANYAIANGVKVVGSPKAAVGGAPPSPSLIETLERLGISVTHLYGLTETYGPSLISEPKTEWATLSAAERARLAARQGFRTISVDGVRVVDERGDDVPADGQSAGEIVIRSNTVMQGYFRDAEATEEALVGGWFRTGDLAVVNADGSIEIVDRRKDIIISGGENVSSVEVERVLAMHPAVLEVAVVAAPDSKWGEVPVAFVTCHENASLRELELIEYAREHLAHFKVPKRIVFESLPKTNTGKVQKHLLRARAERLIQSPVVEAGAAATSRS